MLTDEPRPEGGSGFARLAVLAVHRVEMELEAVQSIIANLSDPELEGKGWWRLTAEGQDWQELDRSAIDEHDFQLRFVVDAARYRNLIGDDTGQAPECFTLDLSIDEIPNGPRILTLLAGGWTHWPESRDLAPPRIEAGRSSGPWSGPAVATLLDDNYAPKIQELLLELVSAHAAMAPSVKGKIVFPPMAYLAVPEGDWPDSGEEWLVPRSEWWCRSDPVVASILQPRVEDELAGSVQAGTGTLTLSRWFERSDAAFWNFLFLPSSRADLATFEDDVWQLIQFLVFLDSVASYKLWDGETDLEMVRDRADDWELFSNSAREVLDQLLLAYMTANDTDIERLQGAVDLVRATLLQSVPERMFLQQMEQKHKSSFESLEASVQLNRRNLGERTLEGLDHVDEALTKTGIIQQLDLLLDQTAKKLERLAPIHDLIDQAAAILAERREQALARLASTGHRTNMVLLVLALGTALDLLVHFNWERTYPWVSPLLRIVLIALLGVMAVFLRFQHIRKAPADIEMSFAALRRRLVAFQQRNAQWFMEVVGYGTDWVTYDKKLAAELAVIWDEVEQKSRDLDDQLRALAPDDERRFLDLLLARTECWALRVLLFGKRTFPLSGRLPRVACLFHFREGGRFVSEFEFSIAMGDVLSDAKIKEFEAWGCREGPSARSVSELLEWVEAKLSNEVQSQPEGACVA